ncbi:Retrovirus-related Pol polyprotein from transposon TNT 1-94 [Vitis vinifera]|uniref:Retrovirus-related Pol polyprotein from transposon TNT 1-94 n=1 Tax=Vitis vinifera TaxID=29760 RepID=A0A438JNB9_VITVI|nr:Retrovirus-related Pol polyprotein from transposon TNT 1-94 [Vitis vinifera]
MTAKVKEPPHLQYDEVVDTIKAPDDSTKWEERVCPENPSGHLLQESGRKHQSQLSERRYQGAIVPPDLPRINIVVLWHFCKWGLRKKFVEVKLKIGSSMIYLTMGFRELKDPTIKNQGPFLSVSIISRFKQGFFGMNLLVRLSDAPEGMPFHDLDEEMNPRHEASRLECLKHPWNQKVDAMLQQVLPLPCCFSLESEVLMKSDREITRDEMEQSRIHETVPTSPFNKEQMEMLQKLLSPLLSVQSQTGSSSNQVIGSGTLAHKGNFLSAFTAVRIADGSLSKVVGTGSVVLSRDLTLNSVLLVPNLDCNLLSISKLTKEKRCITNFSSTHCEFQDLDSGKTIGNAEECFGLYILKEHHDPQEQPQMTVGSNSFSVSCQNNDSAIRMSSRVLKFQTPCQTLLKSFPTTRLISTVPPKIFGCSVFVHINQQHRSKLDPRSLKCIFLRYSSNQKGYKCYSPVTRKFYNSMDVTFFETQPYYPKNDIQGENSTQEYQFWDLESFSESPITTENHIPPESFNQPESIVDLWDKEHIQEETKERALSQQTHEAEPGPNPSKLPAWRKGVRSCTQHPIGNFISYDKLSPTFRAFTSSITDIQVPQNIQEAFKYPKWKAAVDEEVRALEKNGTWEITDLPRGKKLVGCKWIFTVKYKADVAKLNTVRVLLSLAANLDWSLHQLDVKNAFLNGDLEEEVYMDIPAGLETTSNFNKVCRLRKSLYGPKQSPRAWFERFTKMVKGYGFVQCDHEEKIDLLKKLLTKEFEIKDLGNLKNARMQANRNTMDTTVKLEESDGSAPVDKGRYQRLVGKLIYLSHTRPDIGFSVGVVSQFMNNPTEKHMTAVIRILRYLKMTPGKGLFFQRTSKKEIEIFSDADWVGSVTDRRSTSGYCSFVWGNLVTWRSKKQSVVARSSAEAEFRAMAQGICEGIWLNRLLEELRVPLKHPMVLYCDNQAAISIKHVEID